MTNTIIKQSYPSYFPTIFSNEISELINNVEKYFKQSIKTVFPYPMDIIKVFDKKTGKICKLIFNTALAGVNKSDINVKLKNKKFLTIDINPLSTEENNDQILTDDESEYEFVVKGISYRNASVTFRIIPEIDIEKFKPVFKNGILTIELYVKDQISNDDIIIAELD